MKKSIVIIGASSGIGKCIARIYADRGCRVAVCARRLDRLDELARQYPDSVTAYRLDVDSENIVQNFDAILADVGDIDIILNCAGIGKYNPELDTDTDLRTIKTDCLGFTAIADAAYHYFAGSGRKGQFAAISSIAGVRTLGMSLSYSAAKRFQNAYLEGLDQLRRMQKVPMEITDIRPGFVATDLLDKNRKYPMLMKPERVASLAVRAIDKGKRVAVIDWRFRILVSLWSLIPRSLWVRLPIRLSL